jgi:hypothetical protein
MDAQLVKSFKAQSEADTGGSEESAEGGEEQ